MALYGFNANSNNDRLAITNILANSYNVSTHEFDSLAQYKIKDVELVPTSVELSMPRQWGLNVMTSLEGFNSYDGNPVWFKESDTVDSCITYSLSTDDFVKMIQGGLYVDPVAYLKKLQDELSSKSFYRKSRVQLIKCQVLDTASKISAGDLSEHVLKGTNFYIGSDLDTYQVVSPELQSNFVKELSKALDTLVKTPILVKEERSLDAYRDLNVTNEVEMLLEQLGLTQKGQNYNTDNQLKSVEFSDPTQAVMSESEVPDLDSLVTESSVKSQELSQVSIGSDNNDVVKSTYDETVKSDDVTTSNEVVSDVEQNNDFYDVGTLMDKISSINNKKQQRKRKQRVYVDDFAKALADSKAQVQIEKKETKQDTKSVDNDRGLEL